ncbi:MAG TPA: cell division protein SepF [Candidatus Nanoarchaeia archaeon]|nr:cell division protein SepF [Candidatus Nanoarchaeia archaeon]
MVINKIKKGFSNIMGSDSREEDYVEVDLGMEDKKSKVNVRPFILKKFEDVNDILSSLREGYTIAVIDIQTLRKKDVIELKRAISKVKKTVEAMEGSITGFGENIVIATPQFAQISAPKVDMQEPKNRFDSY